MKLTPQQVVELVKRAGALAVDEGPLLSDWEVEDLTGDPKHVWLIVSWHDPEVQDEGLTRIPFTESGLADARAQGNVVMLQDDKGEWCDLVPYELRPLLLQATKDENSQP